MLTTLHRPRLARDVLADAKTAPGCPLVLDGANDAWLDREGRVYTRHAPGFIGDVSHLHGAARVSAALRILADHRA